MSSSHTFVVNHATSIPLYRYLFWHACILSMLLVWNNLIKNLRMVKKNQWRLILIKSTSLQTTQQHWHSFTDNQLQCHLVFIWIMNEKCWNKDRTVCRARGIRTSTRKRGICRSRCQPIGLVLSIAALPPASATVSCRTFDQLLTLTFIQSNSRSNCRPDYSFHGQQ